MNRNLLICISVCVIFTLLFLAVKPDFSFVNSTGFTNNNQLISVSPTGEIILVPSGNVDTAINSAVKSSNDYGVKTYQPISKMPPI